MKKLLLSIIGVLTLTNTIAQEIWTSNSPWIRHQNQYGYIDIGPLSSTSAHIYTDRANFYFNKDLYSATGGFSSATGINLSLKTNGIARMTFNNATGFAGINTMTPTERLHVVGNFLLNGTMKMLDNNFFRLGDPYSPTGSLSMHHNTNGNTYCDLNGSFYFRKVTGLTNNGATLGILNNGTVTIGVWESMDNNVANTQGNKLMVNGGILCESLKVIGDVPNSDHVFTKEYKLRPLQEVKAYVWNNKHLPEIPSAQEFKDNGYSVGTMDDLLLRKVEELTLYVIQLQEELDKLKLEKK